MVIRNYAMHNPLKLAQRCFLKKGLKYLKMYFSVPKLLLILLIQHFILYSHLFMPISMMFFNDVLTSFGIRILCTTPYVSLCRLETLNDQIDCQYNIVRHAWYLQCRAESSARVVPDNS